jgi:hypothetical protein
MGEGSQFWVDRLASALMLQGLGCRMVPTINRAASVTLPTLT